MIHPSITRPGRRAKRSKSSLPTIRQTAVTAVERLSKSTSQRARGTPAPRFYPDPALTEAHIRLRTECSGGVWTDLMSLVAMSLAIKLMNMPFPHCSNFTGRGISSGISTQGTSRIAGKNFCSNWKWYLRCKKKFDFFFCRRKLIFQIRFRFCVSRSHGPDFSIWLDGTR